MVAILIPHVPAANEEWSPAGRGSVTGRSRGRGVSLPSDYHRLPCCRRQIPCSFSLNPPPSPDQHWTLPRLEDSIIFPSGRRWDTQWPLNHPRMGKALPIAPVNYWCAPRLDVTIVQGIGKRKTNPLWCMVWANYLCEFWDSVQCCLNCDYAMVLPETIPNVAIGIPYRYPVGVFHHLNM